MSLNSSFPLNGAVLHARSDGALYWPDRETLIVADLHLEKGSAFASATGQMLPPYDSRATLTALRQAMAATRPKRVICLGDSFHDVRAAARLTPQDRDQLVGLTRQCDWVWIAGNHDPAPPADLGGIVMEEAVDGPLVFRHEASPQAGAGEISGHFHPKAAVETRARRLSARCFVEDSRRLILPAFGAYTGGLNVWDTAISGLFPKGFTVHLALRQGVLRVPRSRLRKAA
ncbi:ligase-associated DNA damage response endonuclease PdeM [Pacificispira sp.]|uniref:ligase-associated DNA damage response endonuclease PdeM n=1 Tax=Pacificispira sp. TaxID=2888761 RepID=UPI003BAD383E